MQGKLDGDAFGQLLTQLVEQLNTQDLQLPVILLSETLLDGCPQLKEIAFVHKTPEFDVLFAEDRNLIGIGIVFENKNTKGPSGPRGTVLNGGDESAYNDLFIFDGVEARDDLRIGFLGLDFTDQVEITHLTLAEILHLQFIVIQRVPGQVNSDHIALMAQLGDQIPVFTLRQGGLGDFSIGGSSEKRHGRAVLVILIIARVLDQSVDSRL